MLPSSKRSSSSRERDLAPEGSPTVEDFKMLASLSLLPKPAWGLNRELQREVQVAVKIIVSKEISATTVFGALLTTRTVRHLVVHGAMPSTHIMPDTIGALELHRVPDGNIGMPQHLHSLTLVLPQGMGSAYAAAYLTMLPETVHSLALDASYCQANWTDLALPARLRTLQLTHLCELPALPASLTSIMLESCLFESPVQLPPSLTEASLVRTSCHADNYTRTSMAVLGPGLRRLRLMEIRPTWAVHLLPLGLTDLHINYEGSNWGHRVPVALTALPQSLQTLMISSRFQILQLTLSALPQSLRTLDATRSIVFNTALGPLPEGLTHLSLGGKLEHALRSLPAGLTELRVDGTFNQPLGALPPSLRVLDVNDCEYNLPLGRLPRTLRELRLGTAFNQPLLPLHTPLPAMQGQQAALPAHDAGLAEDPLQSVPDMTVLLPEALTVLHVGEAFDHPLGRLPESLTELRVGDFSRHGHRDCCFSHTLGPLPAALRILDLGVCAAYHHALGDLPDALRELRLGGAFHQPLP
ncbi:hypothetical protein JKP88DRAFT_242775 [Tribonema minus]|uniref:Uncharacterized protein n=1 Tax=Tribonema minus TaxID=303371 RepID=A0A835ZDY6_9STRA|nr:hypothetical protein JKP88DRAFT_242775 [Tribonema minus]